MNETSPIRAQFHYQGIIAINLKEGPAHKRFIKCLDDIASNNLKEGFSLEQKYPTTADLRPNAYEYDESVLDVLFEADVPTLLRGLLGQEMYLSVAQIRQSYHTGEEEQNSYMSWHRDVHWYQGEKQSGNIPPVYKLIFYPNITGEEQSCLHFCMGSHLRVSADKQFDYKQITEDTVVTVVNSNIGYTLINTSAFHHAIPPKSKSGQLRVIYSFCLESQLDGEPEHSKLHEMYKVKLKEYNENLHK
tara:strand:+ start:8409 stop:9146 length:738 start_codon:yes stop_codon:yes gene_type:complete